MINRTPSAKRNTFRADQIIYDKDQLIDCSNKSTIWMHSVERKDTKNGANIATSFGILLAFVAFVICLFYIVGQSKANPEKQIVKLSSKP